MKKSGSQGIDFINSQAIDFAREVLHEEAAALNLVAQRLDENFLAALQAIWEMTTLKVGRIAITGTGKSADVGLKMVGTLNSTGTRSYFLDAVRAVHGDLGMLHPEDIALVLSHSGESEEILRLLGPLQEHCKKIIGLTGNKYSTLGKKADITIAYGPLDEVCPLGLAPSASSTSMIALGDAMAFCLIKANQFCQEDFAKFHPAGSLGKKLMRVETVMRHGHELRLASAQDTVRAVFSKASQPGRRTGAVILIDSDEKLCGIFTDSDLARLIETRNDNALDKPISEVMTKNPKTILLGSKVVDAIELMKQKKLSEIPVVDATNTPRGLLDITDLISLAPAMVLPSSKVA
ncbi:MAG: hypothetical protein RLZ61_1185 [Planctomycetota bacterium]|jgi:arabinose-5-phosphate isomerase|nr:KpsF/GutQ family sugar-phosphate isomerase [Gemmataceae bacterium]